MAVLGEGAVSYERGTPVVGDTHRNAFRPWSGGTLARNPEASTMDPHSAEGGASSGGFGFRDPESGFRDSRFRCRVQGAFRLQGAAPRTSPASGFGIRDPDFGFRDPDFGYLAVEDVLKEVHQDLLDGWFGVSGFGFQVWGLGFGVSGFGFRVGGLGFGA